MKAIICLLFIFPMYSMGLTNNCNYTTQTEFGATTVSTVVLQKNANRKCLTLQSKGTVPVFVKFGSASSGGDGFALLGSSTPWISTLPPSNSVYLKSHSGTVTVTVQEGQ